MPSIAAYWVKNNVLAAVISAAVSFSIFSLKSAAGVTVPGPDLGPS